MPGILIKAIDAELGDVEKDRGSYKKGYPAAVVKDDHVCSNGELPPVFIKVVIDETTEEALEKYVAEYRQDFNYDVKIDDLNEDVCKITITVNNLNASNDGALLKEQFSKFLNMFSDCSLDSFAENSVTISFKVFNIIKSVNFWSRRVSDMTISEISYDKDTGVHKISADFSLTSYSKAKLENTITAYNAKVTPSESGILEFDLSRDDIVNFIKQELGRFKKRIRRCRYCLSPEIVDDALRNDGVVKMTEEEFAHNLTDMFN